MPSLLTQKDVSQKYASEMEKVHIPAFDADDEDVDSDEDDYPDDDGRFDAYA